MNKALRFVWLSLLTLICGVASAGTVVFDPTQASDVTTGEGTTITKNGITLTITQQNASYRTSFDATTESGKVCYTLQPYCKFTISSDGSVGNIKAVTCEFFGTGSLYTTNGGYLYNAQKCSFGDNGYSSVPIQVYWSRIFLTKLTIECEGGEEPDPGPGGGEEQTTTIAQLMQGGVNVASANIKFTNAQVVYAEGNNYIVRENNQAIDIMGSSLALSQGDKLNGTVMLSVTYKNGILTTTDISGSTNSDKLNSTPSGSTDYDPIHCSTVADMLKYPGDLLVVENATYDGYNGYCADRKRYFTISNAAEKGVEQYQKYDMTVWFNNVLYTNPKVKIVKLEPVITSLDAPSIMGETSFEESTTVTINSDQSVAAIYYTTNGDEPTTSSTLYQGPFTLTESATVKAIAAYKTVVSPVATCVFEKIDANVTKTIAELAATQNNYPMVKVSFNNAQVVYADGKNFILREDGKALDVMNSSLNLQQGAYYQGTVRLKVTCENGILKAYDVEGKTDATDITPVSQPTTKPSPIVCTVAEAAQHPGDLIKLEGLTVTYWNDYYSYDENSETYVYFSNGAGMVQDGKQYDLTVWYNDRKQNYSGNYFPLTKIVVATPAITHLDAPTISGDALFVESTNVTITSPVDVEGVAIYYTLGGTDPTTASQPYNAPIPLTETTTVKAIAVYKSITSDVATMTFEKFDANAPRTIADLASIKTDLASVTVSFVNAKVVYGEDNNFILRENIDGKYYALDVLNTQLPFKIGATVSGTVKLKVAFKANPAENNGVLSTADVTETLNHNLTITPGTSVMPIPLEVPLLKVRNYPGDLLVVKDGKWDPSINGIYEYEPSTTGWGHGAEHDVYVSNYSEYTFGQYQVIDVMLWYNDVYTEKTSPRAKIIGAKDTYEYVMTAAGWGTIIIPFDCEKPEGLTVYDCSFVSESGMLMGEEVSCFKANTPYLVKGTPGIASNYTLEGYAAKHEEVIDNGIMTGTYVECIAPVGSYVLQDQDAGVAFYQVGEGVNIKVKANRCYLNPQSNGVKSVKLPDDNVNGVTNVNSIDSMLVDVYTMAGVKVKHQVEKGKALNDLPAGLYIINNKKIVKK